MGSGWAATLHVGVGQAFRAPSEAASVVHDGDTVVIEPGEYFDCAVWHASDLTIAGNGPGVVLTDKACEGKALFVMTGNGITIRDLTFTRVRVADRNGAGIRAEGGDLTIERSRFVNNEIGILAADAAAASLVVQDCSFADNGTGDGTADILAGGISLLRVERSEIRGGKGGASITSSAKRTELSNNRIEAAEAALAYVIGAMRGGSLAMDGNEVTLTGSTPRLGVVVVAADGAPPAGETSLHGTILINRTGRAAILLRDWTGVAPSLSGNVVQPGDAELSTEGAMLHRIKQAGHQTIAYLRGLAGRLRHAAAPVLHRFLG